jgi:kinesin family protein 15
MHGPGGDACDGDAAALAAAEERGLIPRTLQHLFERLSSDASAAAAEGQEFTFTARCSYLELYNESVFDLLSDSAGAGGEAPALTVREDAKRGVFAEGATEAAVTSAGATYALFARGAAARRVGATAMNRESSRSHALFTVFVETRRRAPGGAWRRRAAVLHLVDLAGSERQKHSEAAGARLREAAAINKSLSALGNVVKALVDLAAGKERHVPYRDSKLTFLLKEALGGRARCTLLACVTPAERCAEETLSTLQFAARAKCVRTGAAAATDEAAGSAQQLAEEVTRLRAELAQVPPEHVPQRRHGLTTPAPRPAGAARSPGPTRSGRPTSRSPGPPSPRSPRCA